MELCTIHGQQYEQGYAIHNKQGSSCWVAATTDQSARCAAPNGWAVLNISGTDYCTSWSGPDDGCPHPPAPPTAPAAGSAPALAAYCAGCGAANTYDAPRVIEWYGTA